LGFVDFLGLIPICEYWGRDYGDPFVQRTVSDKTRTTLFKTIWDMKFESDAKGKGPSKRSPMGGVPIRPKFKAVGYWVFRVDKVTWMNREIVTRKHWDVYACTDVEGCSVGPWYFKKIEGEATESDRSWKDWDIEWWTPYVPMNGSGEK
jgi:hypothetical protein